MKIGREKFCQTNAPDVTTQKRKLKVQFKSNNDGLVSTGANCTASCPTEISTSAPTGSCRCGLARRSTRIVGGQVTEVNEYPWQAGIVSKGNTRVWCGGSIISDRWILTAAHCTYRETARDIQALLGEHDYNTNAESNMVRMDISKIVNHPDYDDPTTDYDFSLLKMKKALDFDSHYPFIAPICLPVDDSNDYNDYIATVTGWGTTSSGGSLSNLLKEVDVKVILNSECVSPASNYPSSWVTGQMLCAAEANGNGGKDACQGDSGGPLVTKEPGSNGVVAGQNYELIGVVSWGQGCAEADKPGVYARVTEQLDWIASKTSADWNTCPRI